MPKVLHIISGLKVGGAEMALLRLITHSSGGDYTHVVISLTPGGAMHNRFYAAGIELIVLDFKRSPVRQFIRLISLIKMQQPDIVQTWMYHADLLGGLATRLAGRNNIIWGIRTSEVHSGGRSTIVIRKVCALLSRHVPHTIICAADASRQTHVAFGYDESRMTVVPNGFDLSLLVATSAQREALRLQCGLASEMVTVGYVGRFHPDKDPENFVRAAGLVAQQYKKARFLMVGRNLDANNVQLATWIESTGYADRFVLLGERSDVHVCLSAMDFFCQSSRTEGFPNVVGEAMGMGLPCVVTDVGDAAVLVADTGVIIPKEDHTALARGMENLLEMTTDARQQLGQKAKMRIQAEFTMQSARERYESIYQRITTKGLF